jgi:hypothetical protein
VIIIYNVTKEKQCSIGVTEEDRVEGEVKKIGKRLRAEENVESVSGRSKETQGEVSSPGTENKE